jgi:hypothetical protein
MKKVIRLKESDIQRITKRLLKEESAEDKEYKEWKEEDDKRADIYNEIYDTLEPVLNNILDKYGEDFDLIANDDMIQNIVEDWLYSGDED